MTPPELLVTSNATDLSADGWLKIAPWGDHPNSVGLQRVQKEDGDAMVAAFNSLVGKAGRMFRGVPIFVGHPDRDPARYPDKRRYGKITALESRADGLYAKPAFNDIGQQVIEQGHYLYNSPVWALRREGGVVRPIELLSIGLTNEPNIKGEPWAKNEQEETGARSQEPATNQHPNPIIMQITNEQIALVAANGDFPGHPFRGNQYASGSGGGEHNAASAEAHKASHAANDKKGHRAAAKAHLAAAALHEDAGNSDTADYHSAMAAYHGKEAAMHGRSKGANEAPPAAPATDLAPEVARLTAALAATNDKLTGATADAKLAKALLAEQDKQLAAANAKAATERTARIELAANSIIAAGRRTTAQRAELVKELTAANDLDAAITAATNAKPALPTTSAVANLGQRKAEGHRTAIVAINESVLTYAAENKIDVHAAGGWERAWNGCKLKHPALFTPATA